MSQSSIAPPATTAIRRTAARGEARRAEIMIAAEDVFLEQGYANSTMDAIAARAGASKATFYKHFGSKEALFAEIVHSRVLDISASSGDALIGQGKLSAVLVEWGVRVLRLVTSTRAIALYRLILSELPRSPELGRIFYDQGPAAGRRQLAAFLKRATREGQLACPDPERAAALLNALIFLDAFERAVVGQSGAEWQEKKVRAHIEEAVALFLARYGR